MKAYRICNKEYASDPLNGQGAAHNGARWNSPGVAVAYTSENRALAILETYVHTAVEQKRKQDVLIEVDIPDELSVIRLLPNDLPLNWKKCPSPFFLQDIGNTWVRDNESAVLAVPSIIAPEEFNYLINPAHPDFKKIKFQNVRLFKFDKRMWK